MTHCVYKMVAYRKKPGNLLDNHTAHAYASTARLLDRGQALCNGPLLEEIWHDKGRARRPSGSRRAAPKAPDGHSDHALLTGDYGGAACGGECRIAWLWAFPTPPPPAACWTQPTHGGHGADSRQNDPCIYRGESLSSAGANRCRNCRCRRRRCYPRVDNVLVGHARRCCLRQTRNARGEQRLIAHVASCEWLYIGTGVTELWTRQDVLLPMLPAQEILP